jgi:hypothetical protein
MRKLNRARSNDEERAATSFDPGALWIWIPVGFFSFSECVVPYCVLIPKRRLTRCPRAGWGSQDLVGSTKRGWGDGAAICHHDRFHQTTAASGCSCWPTTASRQCLPFAALVVI